MLCDWAECKKALLMMYPYEEIDKKAKTTRIDVASDSTLGTLSPEIRESMLNDETWDGDVWKSDAYSLGILSI